MKAASALSTWKRDPKVSAIAADSVVVATDTTGGIGLELLLAGFDRDATEGREQIRGLLKRDPQAFQEGIARVVKCSRSSSRALQFAVGLLAEEDLILPTLCDPSLDLEGAISLARTAMQVDPAMDVTLAKKLADATARGEPVRNAGRVMDILGEISNGNRITSSLMRLWRSSDAQMRSKAVLLIGRSSRSVHWAQSRLAEADPRIRANALESLWGVDTAEAKAVLRASARDGNNRVAGNALFALYAMGDTAAISDLTKMAVSESPLFRSSAAWAMGESGDPRFSETLGRMIGETNAAVRKRAFLDLSRLKAAAKARQGREWLVGGRMLAGSETMRQFGFEASPTDGGEPPELLPTQLILSEDNRPVAQYQVEAYPPPEALAVTILFPHIGDSAIPPWVQGAIDALRWKRPCDLWRVTFYLPSDEPAQGTPDLPQFTLEGPAAAAALREPPARSGCPPFWDGVRNSIQAANTPECSGHHLVVFIQSAPAAPEELSAIVAAAAASNTSVQVISLAPSAPLEELCRRTRGGFRLAASERELPRLVEKAHLALIPRYLVSYSPFTAGAREINIRVFDPTGWGETTVLL
jgi:HEAT repeats